MARLGISKRERILWGIGITVAVLFLTGVLLYGFGGMWPPSEASRAAYAAMVARGEQPTLESRFVIPIPGCVCHHDDPVVQMRHSNVRISAGTATAGDERSRCFTGRAGARQGAGPSHA
jgi:hypothetical protein